MKIIKSYCIFIFCLILFTACNLSKEKKKETAQLEMVVGKSQSKPNILFIAVDDLKPELNFYFA